MRGNGLLVAAASACLGAGIFPIQEAGGPLALRRPSGTGEVSDVTIYVWYLRNIVARPERLRLTS